MKNVENNSNSKNDKVARTSGEGFSLPVLEEGTGLNNNPRLAATYSRSACVQQNQQGNEAQEQGHDEYAKRHNITLLPLHRYSDVGKSGMRNNDALIDLMNAAASGTCPFSVLLIKSPERLGRSDELMRKNLQFFLNHGITILSWEPNLCITPDENQSLSQAERTRLPKEAVAV